MASIVEEIEGIGTEADLETETLKETDLMIREAQVQ